MKKFGSAGEFVVYFELFVDEQPLESLPSIGYWHDEEDEPLMTRVVLYLHSAPPLHDPRPK